MNSAEMVARAFRDARAPSPFGADMSGVGRIPVTRDTVQEFINQGDQHSAMLHLMQMRQAGLITRHETMVFSDA